MTQDLTTEMLQGLASTAIDRQNAQLDLTLQLIDDENQQIRVSIWCLCGAVGHAAGLLARSYHASSGRHLDADEAVKLVLNELVRVTTSAIERAIAEKLN